VVWGAGGGGGALGGGLGGGVESERGRGGGFLLGVGGGGGAWGGLGGSLSEFPAASSGARERISRPCEIGLSTGGGGRSAVYQLRGKGLRAW